MSDDPDKTPVDRQSPMDLVLAKLGELERKVDGLHKVVQDSFNEQFQVHQQRLPELERRVTVLERARVWLPAVAAVAAGMAVLLALAALAKAALP